MRIGTRHHERGSNMVEAALVMPMLFLVIAIMANLGLAFFVSVAVIDAAREGARYGVTNQNATEMCARAMTEANLPLGITATCSANTGQGSGTPVKVTVSCNVPLIMGGLVGRSSLPVSYTAAFRIR